MIDTRWMTYLQEMDYLKTGIGLRGFGQRDPLVEYKTEAYAAFTLLVNTMYEDFLRTILRLELINRPRAQLQVEEEPATLKDATYSGGEEMDGDLAGIFISARCSSISLLCMPYSLARSCTRIFAIYETFRS